MALQSAVVDTGWKAGNGRLHWRYSLAELTR